MKLAIMQPYFFPYIGYWQLMGCVDTFVIYDDVNFIKGGWINRNKILLNGKERYVNLPMLGISPNKQINEVMINRDRKELNHTLNLIKEAYRGAPYFNDVYQMIIEIFNSVEETASGFIADSFRFVCLYLGIKTNRILSSKMDKNISLKGEAKVIDICERLKADEYINPIGGMIIYKDDSFSEKGVKLKFLKTNNIVYNQNGNSFIPNLSIIDVMMFNSRESVMNMLNDYKLVTSNENMWG